MRFYENDSLAKAHIREFKNYGHSHTKSIREDFNDKFFAENEYRRSLGDYSLVFVLTFNDEHILRKFGRNLLNGDALKVFSQSSAFVKFLRAGYGYDFKYVCVGEYGNGGKSHDYEGKRGDGNNPHYHCTGWFHQVGEMNLDVITKYFKKNNLLYILDRPLYEQLCLLVRFNWQHSLEDDPFIYSMDVENRKLGNGYVCLDGEIKTSCASTYISKYMGKDMKSLFSYLLNQEFNRNIFPLLRQFYKEGSSFTFEQLISMWIDQFPKTVGNNYIYLRLLSVPKVLYTQYDFIYEDDTLKQMNEFVYNLLCPIMKEISTIYSPKVRKFQQFGYSLFENANIEDGTYTITKVTGSVTRVLPPALIRHFYYNHYTCFYGDKKIVKYSLNDNGIKMLHKKLVTVLFNARLLVKMYGSELLKQNADFIVRFAHCVVNYDYHFPIVLEQVCKDDETAIKHCIDLHITTYVNGQTLEVCRRPLFDVLKQLKDENPFYHGLYVEYLKIRDIYLSSKDVKDEEFLKKCMEIYKLSY